MHFQIWSFTYIAGYLSCRMTDIEGFLTISGHSDNLLNNKYIYMYIHVMNSEWKKTWWRPTVCFRKRGFRVLTERCFKQTAMKYVDTSIKLSSYRQFPCLWFLHRLRQIYVYVSPRFFGEFGGQWMLIGPPFWNITLSQFYAAHQNQLCQVIAKCKDYNATLVYKDARWEGKYKITTVFRDNESLWQVIVPEKPHWGGNNKVCMYVCIKLQRLLFRNNKCLKNAWQWKFWNLK